MREIHSDRLWTGNAREARDTQRIFDAGISAVVDLAYEEPPAQLSRQLVYCRIPIVDGTGNDPLLLRLAVSTTVELLRAGTRTLVACSAGMSRSPIVAVCALAVHLQKHPNDVLALVNRQTALEIHGELWGKVSELACVRLAESE